MEKVKRLFGYISLVGGAIWMVGGYRDAFAIYRGHFVTSYNLEYWGLHLFGMMLLFIGFFLFQRNTLKVALGYTGTFLGFFYILFSITMFDKWRLGIIESTLIVLHILFLFGGIYLLKEKDSSTKSRS